MKKKLIIASIIAFSNMAKADIASWYSNGFEGKRTASGYVYNSNQLTCASNKYDFGTVLKVTSKDTNKSVLVVVTDRGNFDKKYGRDIDLSKKAFSKIDNIHKGIIDVDIKVVNKDKVFRYKHGSPLFKYTDYVGGDNDV